MNSSSIFRNEKTINWTGMLCLFTVIVVVNILTLSKVSNIILTIPQYIWVFYLIFKNDLRSATIFHFCFFILSLSAQKTLGMMDGAEFSLYNYGTIKLIGPIRAAYLINIILVILCLTLKLKPRKDLLFFKFFKVMMFIGATGSVIGIIGIIFHPYYTIDGFVGPVIYMFVVLSSCYILLCLATERFIETCYHISIISTMAGIFASYLCYSVFGVVSSYSTYDIIYCADCMWFAAILIAGVLFIKEKFYLILSLIVYVLISINIMEGKSVFNAVFAFCCLVYYVFFDRDVKRKYVSEVRFMKIVVLLIGLYAATHIALSSDTMALYKIQSALSIFSMDIDNMANSPYIRFASLMNILNDGLHNPFTLIFGNGYGGYFEDNLNLFYGLDLSDGAWPDSVISTGRFPNGHDTMVNVPLYNGLLGFYLICKICILYTKNIKNNFLSCVAFMWIFLMFYFNTIFAVMGVVFLFGAEYNYRGYPYHDQIISNIKQ